MGGWDWKNGKHRSLGPMICFFCLLLCQVTSQDKAPSVISRVLKKNHCDHAVASEYELVQLLPGERGQGPAGRTAREESGAFRGVLSYLGTRQGWLIIPDSHLMTP